MPTLNRIVAIIVILLFLSGVLTFISTPVSEDRTPVSEIGNERITTKASDFVDTNDPLGTYYPGDKDITFTITVYNDYDHSLWNDQDGDSIYTNHWPEGDGTDLPGVKLNIIGVVDENLQAVSASPLDGLTQTVYNGATGSGYEISGGRTYYKNDDNDPFGFSISESVAPGDYYLEVQIEYFVRTSWWDSQTKYNLTAKMTETEYIDFSVRSSFEQSPYDGELPASAYSDTGSLLNGGALYAGATFQEIRIPVTAKGFKVESIEAAFSASGVSLSSNEPAKMGSLNAGWTSYFSFRLEVPAGMAPQILTTSILTITYKRTSQGFEQTITETDLKVRLVVDYTPVLSPPEDNGHTISAASIDQGTTTNDFTSFQFKNTGNIELANMMVTLDISNARFFSNGGFYYDEGANGNERPLTEVMVEVVGPVGPGKTASVDFPITMINRYLPPGYYKIPITYEAWYYDSGQLAGSTSWKMTTNNEYETINNAVTGSAEGPYLFFKVEDSNGLSAQARSTSKVCQGEQGADLNVVVENLEFYSLTDVTLSLQNCPGVTPTEEEMMVPTLLAASETGGPGTLQICCPVNLDPEEEPGIKTGDLFISGYAPTGDLIEDTVEFNYEITPIPALITVVGVSSTKTAPGKTFELEVEVMNIGGSGASDITVLLALNSNVLTADSNEKTISDLVSGTSSTVTFNVKADENTQSGVSYSTSVYLKWEDSQGNQVQYTDNAPVVFDMRYESTPIQSDLSVTGVTSTEVKPGQAFTLTAEIMNTGSSSADNITVLLVLNNNVMSTTTNTASIASLGSNYKETVTFTVNADKNIEQGQIYSAEILMSWEDDEAGDVEFYQNSPAGFNIRTQEAPPPEEPFITAGTATLIVGLVATFVFLIIGILMFVAVRSLKGRNEQTVKPAAEEAKSENEGGIPAPDANPPMNPADQQAPPGQGPPPQQQWNPPPAAYPDQGPPAEDLPAEQLDYMPPDNSTEPVQETEAPLQQF